jgi:hypothetical protein
MDGLARMLGADGYAEIGGVPVMVRALTLGSFATIEGYLLRKRMAPLTALNRVQGESRRSPLFQDLVKRAIQDAQKDKSLRVIRTDELRAWLDTREGIGFTGWLCCRKRHPVFTSPQAAWTYFDTHHDDAVEFVEVRDQCSGIDLMSSMDFPVPINFRTGKPVEQPRFKFIPWKTHIKSFASAWNWTTSQVSRLTLYALHLYLQEDGDNTRAADTGTTQIGVAEAKALHQMTPEQRKAYIAQKKGQ